MAERPSAKRFLPRSPADGILRGRIEPLFARSANMDTGGLLLGAFRAVGRRDKGSGSASASSRELRTKWGQVESLRYEKFSMWSGPYQRPAPHRTSTRERVRDGTTAREAPQARRPAGTERGIFLRVFCRGRGGVPGGLSLCGGCLAELHSSHPLGRSGWRGCLGVFDGVSLVSNPQGRPLSRAYSLRIAFWTAGKGRKTPMR